MFDSNCYAREKVEMEFSNCYNCGQQGHFASSCPLGGDITAPPRPRGNHPPQWKAKPLRPRETQDRINEWGVAMCRAAIAARRTA